MKVTIMVSMGSRTISVQEDSWETAMKALDERLTSVGDMLTVEKEALDGLLSRK